MYILGDISIVKWLNPLKFQRLEVSPKVKMV